MAKIIIEMSETPKAHFEYEEGDQLSLGEVLSALFGTLEAVIKGWFECNPPSQDEEEDVADTTAHMFMGLLDRACPNVKPPEFQLSDAAVLYAQDKIIEEAYNEGITFEEALNKFEERAKGHIDARKMS